MCIVDLPKLVCQDGLLNFLIYFHTSGDLNVTQSDLQLLQVASQKGHLHIVKYLCNEGANVRDYNDYAVIWASAEGHLDVVEFLVKNGANIKAQQDHALILASFNGHLDMVKYILSLNKSQIHDGSYQEALNMAVQNNKSNKSNKLKNTNNLDMLKFLSENIPSTCDLQTTLSFAAESSTDTEVISYLIEECDVYIDVYSVEMSIRHGNLVVLTYFVNHLTKHGFLCNFIQLCMTLGSEYYKHDNVSRYILSFFTLENIESMRNKIPEQIYKEEYQKLEVLKEQKRQVTDMIYCSPDLLPKSDLRIMGYNVVLGLEMLSRLV